MTPELKVLATRLAGLRASVVKKLSGISEQDARRAMVKSGTNLAGLMQHLTFVEAKWLGALGKEKVEAVRSMQVDPSITLRELRARYRGACDASDEVIRTVAEAKVRPALLVVLDETARHAGHADIIREQIDGQTGR